MRVAELDMTRTSFQCLPGLCLNTNNPRTCRICSYEGSCSSDIYPVGINYSRVCGRVIGYQVGTPDAFSILGTLNFDGIQLTYAEPRTNIWTFVAANAEVYHLKSNVCPCINPSDSLIPSVPDSIGLHYFCDTAAHTFIPYEKFEMLLQIILCGMELAVVIRIHAAPSTILHGFTENCLTSPMKILK